MSEPHTGIYATQFIEERFYGYDVTQDDVLRSQIECADQQARHEVATRTADGKEYYIKWLPWKSRELARFETVFGVNHHEQDTLWERRVLIAYVNPYDCKSGDSLWITGFSSPEYAFVAVSVGDFKKVGDLWVRR